MADLGFEFLKEAHKIPPCRQYANLQVLALLACALPLACSSDMSKTPLIVTKTPAIIDRDSIAILNTLLQSQWEQQVRVTAEKDTAIQALQTAMRLFAELDAVSREVGTTTTSPVREHVSSWDESISGQIADLRQRYAHFREDLIRSENRLRAVMNSSSELKRELQSTLAVVEKLRSDNQNQLRQIEELAQRIEILKLETQILVVSNQARSDTINTLREDGNRVFWVFGTKERLEALDIIKERGGRSLGVTRIGETFTPGEVLDTLLFKGIDKTLVTEIVLPDAAIYQIISNQDLQYATPVLDDRRVRGTFKIRDPRFWDNSRFLILMRK